MELQPCGWGWGAQAWARGSPQRSPRLRASAGNISAMFKHKKAENTAQAIPLTLPLNTGTNAFSSVGNYNLKEGMSEEQVIYCGCLELKWL